MGIDSVLYRIILLLHVASAIVGFGGIIVNGAHHARAFRAPALAARAVLAAAQGASKLAEYAIYAVLPLGIVLVAISDDAFSFGAAWVSASFVVWFLMVGALHGAVRPAVRTLAERADALVTDGAGDTTLESDEQAKAASGKLMIGEAATQLLVVVALILMIWKPGA